MAGMAVRQKEWQNGRMAEMATYVLFTVDTHRRRRRRRRTSIFYSIESELSITTYLFLVFYRSTSLQSQNNKTFSFLLLRISFFYSIDIIHLHSHDRFSKISTTFWVSTNRWIVVVFLEDNSLKITILLQKKRDLFQPFTCDHFSKISRISV